MAHAYAREEFPTDVDPTWENSYRKLIDIHSQAFTLQVSDFLSHPAEERQPKEQSITNFDGGVFVFSITDRESFACLHRDLKKLQLEGVLFDRNFVLAGTKSDLDEDRTVRAEEAKLLAEELGTAYHEVSAKTSVNVQACVTDLLHRIFAHTFPNEDTKSSKREAQCAMM